MLWLRKKIEHLTKSYAYVASYVLCCLVMEMEHGNVLESIDYCPISTPASKSGFEFQTYLSAYIVVRPST